MKYDLHMHTNFSACANKDNSYENLLKLCEKSGLDTISITDHNSCIFHMLHMYSDLSGLYSGKIVTGMECDVNEGGIGFEILAYNFDPAKIFNWTYSTYGTLESRQTKLKDKLLDLIKKNGFSYDQSIKYNPKTDYAHHYIYDSMKGIRANQQLFIKYGIENVHDFYRHSTTNKDFPLYVDTSIFSPPIKTILKEVHNAGGVAILAHPYNYKNVDGDTLLRLAIDNGIDGIEVYHPSAYEKGKIDYLLNLANKHSLIITGGSDYHGTEHRGQIGITYESDDNIKINIDKIWSK